MLDSNHITLNREEGKKKKQKNTNTDQMEFIRVQYKHMATYRVPLENSEFE